MEPKDIKDRHIYDLLNLSHELHCRSVNMPHSEKMHLASVEAKNELRVRLEGMIDALTEMYEAFQIEGALMPEEEHKRISEKAEKALKKAGCV